LSVTVSHEKPDSIGLVEDEDLAIAPALKLLEAICERAFESGALFLRRERKFRFRPWP
jgi:hypothetical protein